MDENETEKRKQAIAIFRHGVISDFVNGKGISREEKKRMMQEKCSRRWQIPHSEKTSVSAGTIYKWIRDYKASGGQLESLVPLPRSDQSRSRAIDDDTCTALVELRNERPEMTVKDLIRQMVYLKRVTPGIELKKTTVHRFLKQSGLLNKTQPPADCRKFEAELPNDLWQSDVMHGPHVIHEGKQRKTYLIGIIDDHSRLIPYAQFYLSETLISYLDALYHALARRGLPRKLYVDNGAAFKSHKLQYVTAALNVTLIHARAFYPQGKGKIERFFKTVRSMFLPTNTSKTLDELNTAFSAWLNSAYHVRPHGATGQTPFARFTEHLHCARPAPSNLTDYFRTIARRNVNKDRTVVLNGQLFEAPVALIGKRVELTYHDSDPDRVEVTWNLQSYGYLTKVSLHVNCRVKRNKNSEADIRFSVARNYSGGSLFGSVRKDEK
jgi:putative transposase